MAGDQPAMPPQQRLWLDQEHIPAAAGETSTQRRKQHPVVKLEPRLSDLPAKNRQLVPEHENLQLSRRLTTPEEHHELLQAADDDVQG